MIGIRHCYLSSERESPVTEVTKRIECFFGQCREQFVALSMLQALQILFVELLYRRIPLPYA